MMVKQALKKLDIGYVVVDLGVIEILQDITSEQRKQLKFSLQRLGFELLNDKQSKLIESIINMIIEMIHYSDEKLHVDHSDFIIEKFGYEYTNLSNMFSEVKGITLQQFIILNKIEKIKELLLYNDLSLKEISYLLQYNSVAHLSGHFKRITGLTPTFYRGIANKRRKNLKDLWYM